MWMPESSYGLESKQANVGQAVMNLGKTEGNRF